MRESDPLFDPRDPAAALALLTRLPVSASPRAMARGARAAWAWPLAGLAVALLAALVAWLARALGLSPEIAALLALGTLVIATGALHEDGLADMADGFWGGHDKARRLEIMKDSRIGSYGVLALILSLGLRAALLIALAGHLLAALAAAAMLSRAAMALTMATLPNARESGLSHTTGRPPLNTALAAAAIAALFALAVTGWAALAAAIATAAATLACAAIARAKIGGQTGDVLGATQQIGEIAALLALSATL